MTSSELRRTRTDWSRGTTISFTETLPLGWWISHSHCLPTTLYSTASPGVTWKFMYPSKPQTKTIITRMSGMTVQVISRGVLWEGECRYSSPSRRR